MGGIHPASLAIPLRFYPLKAVRPKPCWVGSRRRKLPASLLILSV